MAVLFEHDNFDMVRVSVLPGLGTVGISRNILQIFFGGGGLAQGVFRFHDFVVKQRPTSYQYVGNRGSHCYLTPPKKVRVSKSEKVSRESRLLYVY